MRNLHIQTINILKEIADRAGMIEYLEIILEKNGYISESIFYVFSGYLKKFLYSQRYGCKSKEEIEGLCIN